MLKVGANFVLELVAGPAGAVALRVATLDDKRLRRLDDAMPGQAVVVAVAGEEDEVIDCVRRVLGRESDRDVAAVGLDHGRVGLRRIDDALRRRGERPGAGAIYRGEARSGA